MISMGRGVGIVSPLSCRGMKALELAVNVGVGEISQREPLRCPFVLVMRRGRREDGTVSFRRVQCSSMVKLVVRTVAEMDSVDLVGFPRETGPWEASEILTNSDQKATRNRMQMQAT